MRRRYYFAIIILGLILGFWSAGRAVGGAAEQLREAGRLAARGDSEQAEQIYRGIAAGQAGMDYGLEALEKLTCLYAAAGRETEAQKELQEMRSQYRGNSALVRAVTHVGDAYRESGGHVKACEIYGDVISEWPGDEHAMWSQMGLTMSYASQGDNTAAEGAFQQLRTEYAGQSHISRAVCIVGDHYRGLGRNGKAREVYGDVLGHWPGAEFALWARMGEAICDIRTGPVEKAWGSVAKLRADFGSDSRLSAAACLVADEYRKDGKYEKACELYEYVVQEHPEADHAMWSQMGLAICNIRLGENAAAAVSKLLTDFEDEPNLPGAICSIGDEYRRLGVHNAACELYGEILERHPASEKAFWAQMNTAISRIWLKDYSGAEDAVEKVLAYADANDNRVPWAARTIGDEYRKAEKYDEAFELYEYVVENYGKTKEALWSQMNLAIAKVRLGDPNADSATEKLLADHSGESEIAAATCWVADQYRRSGRNDEALKLYKRVVADHAESEYAMWSQMGLAISSLRLGNDPNAQDALALLLASYGEQNGFGKAVSSIARQYYAWKDLEKWAEVYETVLEVVENVPEEKKGLWTGVAEAVANVHLGNDEDAQAALDKMITDFNDHPDLPLALWRAADAYYYSGSRLQGAGLEEKGDEQVKMMVTLGRRLREKLPATDETVEAWFFSGVASGHVEEYLEAIEYYQEVVDRWPAHKWAAHAQYRVGKMHKFMMGEDGISVSECRLRVKEAFEKVVENYPDHYLAEWAGRWLRRNAVFFKGGKK